MVFLSQVALSWKSTPELEPNSCSTNFAGAVCASVALRGEPRRLGSGQTEFRAALDAAPRWFYARQSPGRLNAAYRMCWAEATAASGHSPGGGFSNLPHVLSIFLFWGTRNRRRNLSARAGYQQKHHLYRPISPWPSFDPHAPSSPRAHARSVRFATLAHAKAQHFIPQDALDRPVPTLLVPRLLNPTVFFGSLPSPSP